MSGLWASDTDPVLAILCSDIHLSHKPPVARSAEPDWYAAMARTLGQVQAIADKCLCPVIIAGDIFDTWKVPNELVNFAIDNLPRCEIFAIPGQHDLPFHDVGEKNKSAYGTLVRAGRIHDLTTSYHVASNVSDGFLAIPFPWLAEVSPVKTGHPRYKHDRKDCVPSVAIIHSYIWRAGCGYPGAPEEHRVKKWEKRLKGYSAAVFGDNHKGFTFSFNDGKQEIINCGTLMRRKADEIAYQPQVGLLRKDMGIDVVKLDTSEDKFIDVEKALAIIERTTDMADFLAELAGLSDKALNFVEAVKRYIKDNGIDKRTRRIILEALDGHRPD